MIDVVDASVPVAELLRRRGRELFARPELHLLVVEDQWDEARDELEKRVAVIVGQGRMTDVQGEQPLGVVRAFVEGDAIEIVAHRFYEHMEATARRHVPRDPADWAPVALALDVGILTGDHDYLGCGCATRTVETLLGELGAR